MNNNENQLNNNINQDAMNSVPNPTLTPNVGPVEVPEVPTENVVITPAVAPSVEPVLEPVAPPVAAQPEVVVQPMPEVVLEPQPLPSVEQVAQPEVAIEPAPIENPTVMPVPPVAEPVVETPVANPAPINLQPEGVVVEEPVEPAQTVVEPLMGTSLNTDPVLTNVNLNPVPEVNPIPQPAQAEATTTIVVDNTIPEVSNVAPSEMAEPTVEMMGNVPTPPQLPSEEPKKEKEKKKISPVIILLIIVLILAVGYGVYYFLGASKGAVNGGVKIRPILSNVELGTDLPKEALYYVQVEGANINDCTVDSNVDTFKPGTYTYTVTCGNTKTETQTVTVKDTKAPKVILNEVNVVPNTAVTIEDFIDGVNDFSNYTIESEKQEFDTTTVGNYDIKFKVIDAYQNETEVSAKLVVSDSAPVTYMTCEKASSSKDYRDAIVSIKYVYGFDMAGNFVSAVKYNNYTFEVLETYNYLTFEEDGETFDGIPGDMIHDKATQTIKMRNKKDAQALESEFDAVPFPTTASEIMNLVSTEGYTCY